MYHLERFIILDAPDEHASAEHRLRDGHLVTPDSRLLYWYHNRQEKPWFVECPSEVVYRSAWKEMQVLNKSNERHFHVCRGREAYYAYFTWRLTGKR